MSGEPTLAVEQRVGRVSVISFNRPERHNALNDELSSQWSALVRAAIADSDVRCILLRGEGPSFSSGRDTNQLGRRTPGESDHTFVARAQDLRLAMLMARKPLVAAVKGYVLGGAFEIALAADMRIGATDTTLGFPEINFGLVADTGGTQLLTPLVGPAKAKYLLMSGRRIDAATAHTWGILDWLVAPAELDDAALELATSLAEAPPQAAAMTKQLVDQAWAGSIRNGMGQELLAQVALFAGQEHEDAKAAYVRRLQERRS